MRSFAPFVSLAGCLASASALAVDGVLEVNQACAAQGCFPGDAAGLPVTIDGSAGRSFRLTSDLVVPDAATQGIRVLANGNTDGVTIDLGGFAIRGPTRCPNPPTTACAPAGDGIGIYVEDVHPGPRAVVVRNGSIIGMGNYGVLLGGANAVAENLRVSDNGGTGIGTESVGSRISGCHVRANGGPGIQTDQTSVITDSTSLDNGREGITNAAVISGSTASRNGGAGIFCTVCSVVGNSVAANQGPGIQTGISAISHNSIFLNHGDGIECSGDCAIDSNTVSNNGDLTDPTGDDGISCGAGCLVSGNSVSGNRGIGLRLGADSGYRENVITGNQTKPVESGVNLQDNFCSGTGTVAASCP
jgi:hypothetical protein